MGKNSSLRVWNGSDEAKKFYDDGTISGTTARPTATATAARTTTSEDICLRALPYQVSML